MDYSGKIGPSEVLGGSSSEFSPTQLASAFAAIANGGTYNNAHSIQKVVTHEGDTIEYEHTSHKAMKDYTSYMLAEILKGTFKSIWFGLWTWCVRRKHGCENWYWYVWTRNIRKV